MQSRRTKRLGAFVVATESHGRFWQRDDKLILYRLEPGVLYTRPVAGIESTFAKQTPDAMLQFEQIFLIDPDSHDLVEVLPYNAQRQPVRCRPDGLF
jgi:poly-beta-hydroxyalkanoate depolymerase